METTEKGYCKANSENLPTIDSLMVAAYLSSNPCSFVDELQGKNVKRSENNNHGDKAVGYVQLKRENEICIIKACIKPANDDSKIYKVMCLCEETESKILSITCEDCPPRKGSCEHAVTFLMWVHRRSEEPVSSNTRCYWYNPEFDKSISLEAKDIFGFKAKDVKKSDDTVLKSFVEQCIRTNNVNSILMSYFYTPKVMSCLSVHHLINRFTSLLVAHNAENFLHFCQSEMSQELCSEVSKNTLGKTKCNLAMEMRYARISASKAYETLNNKDESLINTILGDFLFKVDKSKKQKELKNEVQQEISKLRSLNISKGSIFLKNTCPIVVASPEAISEKYVIETKCPVTEKARKKYLTDTKKITPRYMAKVQILMHMSCKSHVLYCVASADFKKTKNVDVIEVEYDENFCKLLIDKCVNFWSKYVYESLIHTEPVKIKEEID